MAELKDSARFCSWISFRKNGFDMSSRSPLCIGGERGIPEAMNDYEKVRVFPIRKEIIH
jgi:hypothetical protein